MICTGVIAEPEVGRVRGLYILCACASWFYDYEHTRTLRAKHSDSTPINSTTRNLLLLRLFLHFLNGKTF